MKWPLAFSRMDWLLLVIIVIGICIFFVPPSERRACEAPYTLAVGPTSQKTSQMLDAQGVKYSQDSVGDARNMSASKLSIPDSAASRISYLEPKITNGIFSPEQTCVNSLWFDATGAVVGVSRRVIFTWL